MASSTRTLMRSILQLKTFTGHAGVRSGSVAVPHVYKRFMGSLQSDFDDAKARSTQLKEEPGNEIKLQMYALFKQASVGKCNTAKPGAFDFVGKAKWSAWSGLGDISQEDAQKQYIALVNELHGSDAEAADEQASAGETEKPKFEELLITNENGVYTIQKNRPKKKNALTWKMYHEIIDALKEAEEDKSVKVAVLTGVGDFYCSGNDLSNFAQIPPEGPAKMARDGREVLRKYVGAYINFPKPLIAAVNGPAIGVAVTVLGLCDMVYATDKATFHTPFMTLGQSPEGCSSYVFPKLMGTAKANEMLLLGRKLTANEAFDRGLVTDVFLDSEFQREVQKRISEMATLPPRSLNYSKALIRGVDKETLEEINERECLRLEERWLSEECMQAIMEFMQKRSKPS